MHAWRKSIRRAPCVAAVFCSLSRAWHSDIKLSRTVAMLVPIHPHQGRTMLRKNTFFRWIALPACVVWGVLEFVALQRAHGFQRGDTKLSP